MEVRNKIAIVTGSGSPQGLGKQFSIKLLEGGAKVCLSDINEDMAKDTYEELSNKYGKEKVHFIKCDVTSEDQFRALYDGCEKYFGAPVSILANNAGVNPHIGWKKCMMVNIIGVMIGTELALEKMSTANGGKGGLVVNTASMAGVMSGDPTARFRADPQLVATSLLQSYSYLVSKHQVVALTWGLGQDQILSCHGVKVQCICPAYTDTDMVKAFSSDTKSDGVKKLLDKSIKRFGGLMTPKYMAENFYRLVTSCANGSVMAVVPDGAFLVADTSTGYVIATSLITKLTRKLQHLLFDVQLLQKWHQLIFIAVFLLFLHFLFEWFLF